MDLPGLFRRGAKAITTFRENIQEQEDFKASEGKMSNWYETIENSLEKGLELIDSVLRQRNQTIDEMQRDFLNGKIEDEELLGLLTSGRTRSLNPQKDIKIVKAILTPGKALEMITEPFKDKTVLAVAEKYKNVILDPERYEFGMHRCCIVDGITAFRNHKLQCGPKGFLKDLTKF